MDSQEDFFEVIYRHYASIAGNKLSDDLLQELCRIITDYHYEQYKRFRIAYPKSAKRYSSLNIKDLNHPVIFEMIISYLKGKAPKQYSENAMLLLSMDEQQLFEFEKNRKEFHNMF